MTKCLNPHCNHTKVVRRGLCNACYQFVILQVRKGKLNMKQLETQGKVLGPKKKSLQAKNAWFFSADNN